MPDDRHETRRAFLQHAARLGMTAGVFAWSARDIFAIEPQNCAGPPPPSTAIKWTPDTNPILPRLAASTLGNADVTKLRSAYAALRKLSMTDPSDPRGWLEQGNKHCWNCGGGLDGQAGEEIHGSWLFLPWHRAYLYFHERILGTLINDPSLRLAYWDWDDASHRSIPAAWATPNNVSNSLWDASRSATASTQAPNFLVGPQVISPIIGAATFAQFGGSSTSPGNLENGPHGGVHIWCGDTALTSANADMGLLDTAAQDPLFYAHHANIDRLWDVWLQASASHKNPTSQSWLRHRFTFWDEKKRWVYITVADVINMSTKLRYNYGTAGNQRTTELPPPRTHPLQLDANKALVIPAELRRRAGTTGRAQATLTTLQLDGVTLPEGASGIIRIVGNKPGAAAHEIAGTPNELGYIAIVPKTSRQGSVHKHPNLSIELNVTDQLPQLTADSGTLRLSYVSPATPTAAPLTFARAALVER
jgi:polyphenol oxidase